MAEVALLEPRHGAARWLNAYRAMVRWHLASLRLWAPTAAAIEILAGVGGVLGIGLFLPHVSERAALYVTTGSATVALILLGLIFGPQLISQQKLDRTYEYLLTLPAPRSAAALGWYTVTLAIGAPAAVVTLAAGALRYGIALDIQPQIVVAVLLGGFTMTMLGYAVGHAISQPMVTVVVSELFVFLAFGYAPINFPASQMPAWLVDINRGLPFLPMATAMRDGLTHGLATDVAVSYAVLVAWALASGWLAVHTLGRRR